MTQRPGQPPPLPPQPLGYQVPTGSASVFPCPRCGYPGSRKVTFTWWGGLVGPKLFSHVKCLGCGSGFNGKSGRSNTTAIAIYVTVGTLLGMAGVGLALAMVIWKPW